LPGSSCEVCGRSSNSLQRVSIEGSLLLVCPSCLSRLGSRAVIVWEERRRVVERRVRRARDRLGDVDLVEDFGERVRRAREARGWSEAALAQRLKVSVDVVRRIESGKLKPSLQLARSLESILKVKLLIPAEEGLEAVGELRPLTFGDVVVVRRGEE
jgi:putative transcription factor